MSVWKFMSDYMEGAHPEILRVLHETNFEQTPGYGSDEWSEKARELIRQATQAPDAAVWFLIGGTQTNAAVLDTILAPYQGVISADTGHISVHEAGTIEWGGHKVLPVPNTDGKLTASQVAAVYDEWEKRPARDHEVMPGAVYLSQPTEEGTLYSLNELREISYAAHERGMYVYVDGARLAYALASPENDITLADLAELADVFYIGGTKCGAFFGEALVAPHPQLLPHFISIMKQHGALLAKGRILGIQFATLFSDDLYGRIGSHAIECARRIRTACVENGIELTSNSPTNQIFVALTPAQVEIISRTAELEKWEERADGTIVMRMCTSWATREEAVEALIDALKEAARLS